MTQTRANLTAHERGGWALNDPTNFVVALNNHTLLDEETLAWLGEIAPEVNAAEFSARLTGQFTAPESGRYTFGLSSAGLSRLYIDGQEVIDHWTDQRPGESSVTSTGLSASGSGSAGPIFEMSMTAGQTCDLKVEYSKQSAVQPVSGVPCKVVIC